MFDNLFQGFISHIPYYLDLEERSLRSALFRSIETITFVGQSSSSPGAESTALAEFDVNMGMDSTDNLSTFIDNFRYAIDLYSDSSVNAFSRTQQLFGGMTVRQSSRAIINHYVNFTKLLTTKMRIFAIALGIDKSRDESGGVSSIEYNTYLEELKYATKVASQLNLVEHDWQSLSSSVLKSLQALGKFLRSLNHLEHTFRTVCSEIQKNLSLETSFPNEIEMLTRRAVSLGTVYGAFFVSKDGSSAEIKSFLAANCGSSYLYSQGLFSLLTPVVKKLKSQVGLTLLSVSNQIPNKLLSAYATEDIIIKKVTEEELESAKMSMLPQQVITQVGEHLLSWVQDLESFASSDALTDLVALRGEASALICQSAGWSQIRNQVEILDEKFLSQLTDRASCIKLLIAFERELVQIARAHSIALTSVGNGTLAELANLERESEAIAEPSESSDDGQTQIQDSAKSMQFVNEWLTAISDSVLAIFISQVLRVQRFSNLGVFQVLTDIDYLSNVIHAMGIRPHPLLVYVKILLFEDSNSLNSIVQLVNSGKPLGALKDILKLTSLVGNAVRYKQQ